jgi:Fibronectin type III domain
MSTRTFPRFLLTLAVAALALGACDAESGAPTQPTPPSPPTALSATALSDQEIVLSWTDASSDETEFRIEFRAGAGAWEPAGTPARNATRFRHRGLAADTEYAYRIQACNDGGCSPYAEVQAATPPPACTVSQPITVGEEKAGELTAADCRLRASTRADRWTLTVDSAVLVRIELASPAFDAYLVLTTSAGDTIAVDDDSGAGSRAARIERRLEPGTYGIWTSSYASNGTGGYGLAPRISPCALPRAIATVQTVSDSILPTDCQAADRAYLDRWWLSVPEWSAVRVNLRTGQFAPSLTLFDSARSAVAVQRAGTAGLLTFTRTLRPGRYFIEAAATTPGAKGAYQLKTTEQPICTPHPVAVGETHAAALDSSTDCVLLDGVNLDRWLFTLTAASRIRMDASGNYMDMRLFVTDSTGSVIANGSDGPEFESGLLRDFVAGTYTIWTGGRHPHTQGSYQFSVLPDPCTAAPRPIPLGQSVSATLSSSDCQFAAGWYRDRWQFTLSSPAQVRVQMFSESVSAYLYLLTESGHEIAANAGGGDWGSALIVHSLATGTYIVQATSSRPNQTGRYLLRVSLD